MEREKRKSFYQVKMNNVKLILLKKKIGVNV